MIFYFCPDSPLKSAGIRIIYRHVDLLIKNGIPAKVLHSQAGYTVPDMPAVPVEYISSNNSLAAGDVVVIPEGLVDMMNAFKDLPVRRMVIALNWRYPYHSLPDGVDWRTFGVERILTHSPFIGDYLKWAMRLPAHAFLWGIKPEFYYHDPQEKKPHVTFLHRKQQAQPELARVLYSRNPAFFNQIKWYALDKLSEAEYARQIRSSSLFLNMSDAEGLPCSLLEAMRAGTMVAGFNSVGGQRELIGSGEKQNCLLAENLDYPTLARIIEPLLSDMISGNMSRWESIRKNAMVLSEIYNLEDEEKSVVGLWRQLLQV